MTLVECPDCGHSVSASATACPSCGRPFGAAADGRYYCPFCGEREVEPSGLYGMEVVGFITLLLLWVIPGVIYYVSVTRKERCEACGARVDDPLTVLPPNAAALLAVNDAGYERRTRAWWCVAIALVVVGFGALVLKLWAVSAIAAAAFVVATFAKPARWSAL